MAAGICLPVLKFSHATSRRNENSIPWQHITSDELFVTVEGNGSVAELIMRILRRHEVLEDVDIGRRVDEAMATRRQLQQSQPAVHMEQLPIFGMTKDVLLAIRYREQNGQVRRLQLRMHTVADCHQVLAILQRRGMEFQAQRTGTARPDTARLDTSHRLLTAQSHSTPPSKPHQQSRPSAFDLPPLEAGSYSHHTSSRRSQVGDPTVGLNESWQAKSHGLSTSAYFTRDERSIPRTAAPDRPSTAQFYRPHTLSPQHKPYHLDESTAPAPLPVPQQVSARSESTLGNEQATSITSQIPSFDLDLRSSGGFDIPQLSSESSASGPPNVRPASSTNSPFPDTLEHEIPPPRELPFKRPESHRSGSDRPTSRPSSALELPPLRKPALAKDGFGSPVRLSPPKTKLNDRPTTGSPLKRTFGMFATEHDKVNSGILHVVSPLAQPPTKQSTDYQTVTAIQEKTFSPMEQLLARKRSQHETSAVSRVPRLSSLADAPHEVVSPPGTAAPPLSRNERSAVAGIPQESQGLAMPIPAAENEASGLKEYAAQTLEDRAATLEEFMISNLESNAFTTLCQDVENCWQRIVLGL